MIRRTHQFITSGPTATLAFKEITYPVTGYEAVVAFHPGRITGCDRGTLVFDLIHPGTDVGIGRIEFKTGSNKRVEISADIFDAVLRDSLSHLEQSRKGFRTEACGSQLPGSSLSPTVPGVWFRVCLDDRDPDVSRFLGMRTPPALVRFCLQIPEVHGDGWKQSRLAA